ncbi:hypothetical protein P0F65_09495 [Sphingomonas sp. I4]
MHRFILAAAIILCPAAAQAWGGTAHAVIDRAAIAAIPADGPVFLRRHADYIAASAALPDTWRGDTEGFSKIEEDPNHGWFREQFAFLKPIPVRDTNSSSPSTNGMRSSRTAIPRPPRGPMCAGPAPCPMPRWRRMTG